MHNSSRSNQLLGFPYIVQLNCISSPQFIIPRLYQRIFYPCLSPHLHVAHATCDPTRADGRNSIHIPHHQLPIHTRRADPAHIPRRPIIHPNAPNRVLMHSEQLRTVRRRDRRRARSVRDTARIGIAERVERGAVQSPHGRRASEACSSARPARLARVGVVKASDELPSSLRAGEDQRLAVVARSDERVFGRPD